MSPRSAAWLALVDETIASQKNPTFQASDCNWLSTAPLQDVVDVLTESQNRSELGDDSWDEYWQLIFERIARRPTAITDERTQLVIKELAEIFLEKFSVNAPQRGCLLSWLATFDAAPLLEIVAREMVGNPPATAQEATLTLSSLFRSKRTFPVDAIFPRLLQGLQTPVTAALVLDLANFLMRHRRVDHHPAVASAELLQEILSQVLSRLEILEESPAIAHDLPKSQELARSRMEQINEGITLAISLCDAIAWIGDRTAIPKLARATELAHRRLRTEAASALARLEDTRGIEILAELAAEPVVRLRALAYLRELGAEERATSEFRTNEALAEAEIVVHLAEPTQFGLPPTQCELLDQTTQFWPGYDNPIECFLFHYTYRAGGSQFANVGIVGPLTRSVVTDLTDLPPPDIYAFYAGWQTEHEDIREVSATEAERAFPADLSKLRRRASENALEVFQVSKLGLFFGDKVLVGEAKRNGLPGAAVVDETTATFYPYGGKRAPLGPSEVFDIYKGRRLLGTFNGPSELS